MSNRGTYPGMVQHVLHGRGTTSLVAMVIPGGTVLLRMKRTASGSIRAIPHVTKKDLQLTIRSGFVEEISWDALEEEAADPEPEEAI
jgi:hypothetical protein